MSKITKSAAILTIKDASDMTDEGRKSIATWLRQQAKDLLKYGDDYNGTMRARYLYEDDAETYEREVSYKGEVL